MLRYDVPPTNQQSWEPLTDQDDQYAHEQTQPTKIETIYVTMSTKDPQRHSRLRWRNLPSHMMAVVAIAMLLTFVVSPDSAMYTTKTLTVPAILLPLQTTTVNVPFKATGVKTYPAIQAHGTLTITNGGSLTQYIQAGFLLTSSSGIEVATNDAVTVPAGNGESDGVATVSASAVVAGSSGNISAYSINRTYGTDIFIKNLTTFTGGQDAYSVQYVTDQDKQTALTNAKVQVEAKQPLVLLLNPCAETTNIQKVTADATLSCQRITYHVPAGMKVTGVRVRGTNVVLTYQASINADT